MSLKICQINAGLVHEAKNDAAIVFSGMTKLQFKA